MSDSTPDPETFRTEIDVRSYELDGLGHVNYAVYLNYLETARFRALESGGVSLTTLAEHGWGAMVVRLEIDYRSECRFGDRLTVLTEVEEFRNSSMVVRQEIRRGADAGTVAASARVVVVWVGAKGQPIRIPPEVRRAFGGG